ncbi:MAG: hypothetical protein QM796_00025 [Chthoniobacteraceae bacterium]
MNNPSEVTVRTFDGFTYQLKIGNAEGEQYPMTVTINADFPKERTPEANEKPQDKAKLDGDFASKQKALHDKLLAEQPYQKWTYLMPKSFVEQLLAKRETLLQPKSTPTPAPSPVTGPVPSIPVPAAQ